MTNRSKHFIGLGLLILGMALGGFGLSLLLKPDQYAATARIKVENDVTDILGTSSMVVYDPYFIQTTFEIIQSQLALGPGITNLNLNEVWGRKFFNGKTIETTETLKIIKSRLRLAPVRNTKLIAITFYSGDPNEAAQVANAIANAYRDYRINSRRELMTKGLEILQHQFQDEEKAILVLQTNVEQLRQKFGIQDTGSTNHLSEQQAYWDEKGKLDQMIKLHHLLGVKLEAEKLDLSIPKPSMVLVIDLAEPPKSPVGPNRILGATMLAFGLISTVVGFFLLKSSRRQTG